MHKTRQIVEFNREVSPFKPGPRNDLRLPNAG